jgi:hypothetical protein
VRALCGPPVGAEVSGRGRGPRAAVARGGGGCAGLTPHPWPLRMDHEARGVTTPPGPVKRRGGSRIRRVTKKERAPLVRRRDSALRSSCKRAICKGIVASWESRLP